MKRFIFFLFVFLLSICGCFNYNAYITSKYAATQPAGTPFTGKQPTAIPFTGGAQRAFTFVNHTGQTIWVGAQGSALPENGGWKLDVGQTHTILVPKNWTSGRFWGRTECTFGSSGAGSCATGDCGGHLQCNGAGGVPPVSLAEFTLGGTGGNDFYDISYVDGFNVPVIITTNGTPSSSDPHQCGNAGCPTDINTICPSELQKKDAGGKVVACVNSPKYTQIFKKACPSAYSYPYDDATSTFTCHNCNYQITFGPLGSP
jgi:Thaumatin family